MKAHIILSLAAIMLIMGAFPAMAWDCSVGTGLGTAYGGGPGVNIEFSVIPDTLNLSLGCAPVDDDEAGKQLYTTVGGKFYLSPATERFRPRVSFYYGNTGEAELVHTNGELTYYHAYKGAMAGFGFSVYFGESRRHGLDLDFPILILSRDETPIIDSGDLSISFGYRYRLK